MPHDKPRRLVDGTHGARIRASVEDGSIAKLRRDFAQYASLRPQVNRVNERLTKLKSAMKSTIAELGEKDPRGHRVVTFDPPLTLDGVTYSGVRNEARKTTYLDTEAAEEILKKRGIYDQCTRTVTEIDQDLVYDAYYRGQLTDVDLEELFKTNVTWAFKADE